MDDVIKKLAEKLKSNGFHDLAEEILKYNPPKRGRANKCLSCRIPELLSPELRKLLEDLDKCK